jgi:hypothetical protein
MQNTHAIGISLVISIIFLCGIGNAALVHCGENGTICPGMPSVCSDRLEIKNTTVLDLQAGEEQDIQINFHRRFCFYDYGTGNVSYTLSDTPLNVTVPSGFTATTASMEYPGVIRIRADPRLPPVNYSFSFYVNGARGTSTFSEIFFVHVKDDRAFPGIPGLQSPLLPGLPFLALVLLVFFYLRDRKNV